MNEQQKKTIDMHLFNRSSYHSRVELASLNNYDKSEVAVARVCVDPGEQDDAVSAEFVERIKKECPSWLDTYCDTSLIYQLHLDFDLVFAGVVVHMSFQEWKWQKENSIHGLLPFTIDVQLGYNTIKEVRLAMRRSYQSASMGELCPIFPSREHHIDPDLVFILMPFTEEWSDRIWRRHIRPTVISLGLKCQRADDILVPGVIMDDIWKAINRANIVIADLTGRNPNVFYELGIAHVVGVPVILLSQDNEVPVFDIAHQRQIRYRDNSEGCELLENHLKSALSALLDKMRFP